jgi:hypothetical protein
MLIVVDISLLISVYYLNHKKHALPTYFEVCQLAVAVLAV